MNLNIGQKIKELRLKKGITQEALAEKMGVSCPAVSKWERGETYPDITMLIPLASYFGVSTDDLLGVRNPDDDYAPEELYVELGSMSDKEKLIETLMRVHRDYPRDPNILMYLCVKSDSIEDKRKYAEDLLGWCMEPVIKWCVVREIIQYETDEDMLNSFMDRYTTGEDMSKSRMLLVRYEYREEFSKYEPLKQLLSYIDLTNNVFSYMTPNYPKVRNIETELRSAKMRLKIINVLCDTEDKNVITGDGQPDLWIENRWHWGIRYCYCLAGSGKKNEALDALEEIIDYIEKFLTLENGTVLDFRSEPFSALEGELLSFYQPPLSAGENNLKNKKKVYSIPIRAKNGEKIDISCRINFDPSFDFVCLTAEHGWEWFDPIRNTDRFKACVARLKKYDKIKNDD